MDDHPKFFMYRLGEPTGPDTSPAGGVLVATHPKAYVREDGKTYCPSCHAVAVDPAVLIDLSCTDQPQPEEVMPAFPKMGDVWREDRKWWVFGRPDDDGSDEGGEWISLDARRPRGGQLFLFGHGNNPSLMGLDITGNIPPSGVADDDTEKAIQKYYRQRLDVEFQEFMANTRLVQVTPLQVKRWEVDKDGVHVLANTWVRPDPRRPKP